MSSEECGGRRREGQCRGLAPTGSIERERKFEPWFPNSVLFT